VGRLTRIGRRRSTDSGVQTDLSSWCHRGQEEKGSISRLQGHIRWPKGMNLPLGLVPPSGVIVLMKQNLRMEQAAWLEGPTVLHCFVVQSGGEAAPVEGGERAVLLRGIFKGTVRTRPEEGDD
jgi:hypothetical protein